MARGAHWLAAALACVALGGCSEDEDGGMDAGASPGTGAEQDAGERDSGPRVWMPPDSGTRDSGSSSSTDAGLAGRMCAQRRDPLPAQVLPRCSADTAQCIADCSTATDADACRDACIAADTTPVESNLNCAACIYLQLFACIDATDCHDSVAQLFCCIEDECPPGSPDGCTETQCGSELMTSLTCGYFANQDCVDFLSDPIGLCFEDGNADGGA